jgi:hypothetical protein
MMVRGGDFEAMPAGGNLKRGPSRSKSLRERLKPAVPDAYSNVLRIEAASRLTVEVFQLNVLRKASRRKAQTG